MSITINFIYKNHRGVVEERTVDVDSLEFQFHPGHDHQPGWFISGFDHARAARRSFRLSNIVLSSEFRREENTKLKGFYTLMNLKGL